MGHYSEACSELEGKGFIVNVTMSINVWLVTDSLCNESNDEKSYVL